eukprot:scaffold15973_cov137-Isochrysis_galbana.AAC.14
MALLAAAVDTTCEVLGAACSTSSMPADTALVVIRGRKRPVNHPNALETPSPMPRAASSPAAYTVFPALNTLPTMGTHEIAAPAEARPMFTPRHTGLSVLSEPPHTTPVSSPTVRAKSAAPVPHCTPGGEKIPAAAKPRCAVTEPITSPVASSKSDTA